MVQTNQVVFIAAAIAAASSYASPIASGWDIEARAEAPSIRSFGESIAKLVSRKNSKPKPNTTKPKPDTKPKPPTDNKKPGPGKGSPRPKVPVAPKRPANMPANPPPSGKWSDLAGQFAPVAIQAFETYARLEAERQQALAEEQQWKEANGQPARRDLDEELFERAVYELLEARKGKGGPKPGPKPNPTDNKKPGPGKGSPRPKVPAAPKRPANMPANPPPSGKWSDLAGQFAPAAIQAFETYARLEAERQQALAEEQQWKEANGQPARRDFDESEIVAREYEFDELD